MITGDRLETSGKDYFTKQSFSVLENTTSVTLLLFATGTVKGTVFDILDNVVGNASLKFDCGPFGGKSPVHTDTFGTFSYDFAPVGDCLVHAAYKQGVGTQKGFVLHGNVTQLDIILDKTIVVPWEAASVEP